jgi:hypothetical protein
MVAPPDHVAKVVLVPLELFGKVLHQSPGSTAVSSRLNAGSNCAARLGNKSLEKRIPFFSRHPLPPYADQIIPDNGEPPSLGFNGSSYRIRARVRLDLNPAAPDLIGYMQPEPAT